MQSILRLPLKEKSVNFLFRKIHLFLADMFHEFTTEEVETFWRLLQKLYRFDGEEQDGFEEKAHLKVEDQARFISDDYEEKIMAEFSKRRYGSADDE